MKEFMDFIRQKKWKNWKKDQWLILFLAGVLLLVIALPASCEDETSNADEEETETGEKGTADGISSDYETELEERLEEALSRMEGVGKVQVMITFRDSGETIVEKDVAYTEEDQETETADGSITSSSRRDSSEETVYSPDSDDGEPVVSKEITPTIEGVLVVAEGGDDTAVAMNISEAVEALFGLEVHKIKVVKMVDGQEGSD